MTSPLRRRWGRLRRPGAIGAIRRHGAQALDQVAGSVWNRVGPRPGATPVGGDPRLALITVNFSTTRYLKLMLLTLAEQDDLGLLHRIVVVDNGSRDGGPAFLDRLADQVPRVHVVHRRHRLWHAPGMRAGVRALDRIDRAAAHSTNLLLFCDTDVVFRAPAALGAVTGAALEHDAALIGEVRSPAGQAPDIQASFFAVRRDVYARRDVAPLVNHGSPALAMQRSIGDAGLPIVHLPTNHGGLTLHRGRAGVEAAGRLHPRHNYAKVPNDSPHFMGVAGGAAIWNEIENRYADLLAPSGEDALIDHLAERLTRLGSASVAEDGS